MSADDLFWLRDLMQENCIEKGDFVLASGLPAKYYYDGKRVTLSPASAKLIGTLFLGLIRESGAEAVGGMAVGADPIAQAVSLASLDDGGPEIPAFIVRPEAKDHGKRDQIASAFVRDRQPLLRPGRKVAIVDDVITTGGSVKGAISAVTNLGCEVVAVLVLVERHEGGGAKLHHQGYNFRRLFFTDESGDLWVDQQLLRRAEEMPGARVLR